MCEKCNCETSENICQGVVKLPKKNCIEDSLNALIDSLESLEHLVYMISCSDDCKEVNFERSKFIFESLEELLNGLPEG